MLLKALLRRPLLFIRVITRAVPYLIIREGSSPLHRADVKRSVRMLFSYLLTFIPWYISSLSVARTFASCRLYAEWRIDDVLAFYCRGRGLHICLPTRRCVRIAVAFSVWRHLQNRCARDFRMHMQEQDARPCSSPILFFFRCSLVGSEPVNAWEGCIISSCFVFVLNSCQVDSLRLS